MNGASKYSYACSAVKCSPNSTVKNIPWVACVALFSRRPWCAHVPVTPDANRIAVFSNGTCIGLNGWIAVGVKLILVRLSVIILSGRMLRRMIQRIVLLIQ